MAAIDTHTIVKELVSSGIKEREAEAFVSNFVSKSEFLEMGRDRLGLATKHDIDLIRQEMQSSAELLKHEFKASLGKIEVEQRWIKAAMVGVIGLLIKIAFFS